MPDALLDAIRRDRERETAGESRATRQPQLTQPRAGEEPRERVDEQLRHVPPADETEQGRDRPEDQPERPAGEVRLRGCLRPERVGIEPGRMSAFELVADEPPVVQRLQMVPRRGLPVPGRAAREEVGPRMEDRGPRGRDPGGEVHRAGERYEACGAASSASNSGPSVVSYRHAPRTVPSWSTRNADLSATSSRPRNSCATPNACTASAFQ